MSIKVEDTAIGRDITNIGRICSTIALPLRYGYVTPSIVPILQSPHVDKLSLGCGLAGASLGEVNVHGAPFALNRDLVAMPAAHLARNRVYDVAVATTEAHPRLQGAVT